MRGFQSRVLEFTSKIPKGRVTTYKELARAIGRPRAWRAVANALAKNPHPIKIPCHRVVRSSGEIGGYTYGAVKKRTSGAKRKIELLTSEGVEVEGLRVPLSKYMFKF